MQTPLALILATVLVAAPSLAQDGGESAAEASQGTPAERLKALREEYQAAQDAFVKNYRAAKTEEERAKVAQSSYPQPVDYLPRAWAIVEEGGTAEGVADTLAWIAELDRSPVRVRALKRLAADFLDSDATLEAVLGCGLYTADPGTEEFLRSVLERSERPDLTGQALYSLSGVLRGLADSGAGVSIVVEGAESPAPVDDEILLGEAEEQLQRVQKEFADLERFGRKLGQLAEADLFELRHLRVGQVAPDIEGTDLDGVPFKLSDYRGKVVMLDFWGNW